MLKKWLALQVNPTLSSPAKVVETVTKNVKVKCVKSGDTCSARGRRTDANGYVTERMGWRLHEDIILMREYSKFGAGSWRNIQKKLTHRNGNDCRYRVRNIRIMLIKSGLLSNKPGVGVDSGGVVTAWLKYHQFDTMPTGGNNIATSTSDGNGMSDAISVSGVEHGNDEVKKSTNKRKKLSSFKRKMAVSAGAKKTRKRTKSHIVVERSDVPAADEFAVARYSGQVEHDDEEVQQTNNNMNKKTKKKKKFRSLKRKIVLTAEAKKPRKKSKPTTLSCTCSRRICSCTIFRRSPGR